MWKRLALIVGTVAGVSYLRKKARQQQAEQELWNQATDDVQVRPAPAPVPQDVPPAQS